MDLRIRMLSPVFTAPSKKKLLLTLFYLYLRTLNYVGP